MANDINPGQFYFRETTRSGSVLWEEVLCTDCLEEMTRDRLKPGEGRRTVRPWGAEPVDCTRCTAQVQAPSMQKLWEDGNR